MGALATVASPTPPCLFAGSDSSPARLLGKPFDRLKKLLELSLLFGIQRQKIANRYYHASLPSL